MISTGEHRRGFVRQFGKRYPVTGQRVLMREHNVAVVYGEHEPKMPKMPIEAARAAFLRTLREGDAACLSWLCVLADPAGSAKKKRADLKACIQKIEDKGAFLFELGSGRRGKDRKQRDDMIADAYEALTSGRVSRTLGAGKLGRPPKWTDPKDRQIVWDEWHNSLNKWNAAAAEVASKRIGRKINPHMMWMIVRDMRRERGDPNPTGRSGRPPGPSFSAFVANGKRVRMKVYFLQRADGAIKIGTSGDTRKRRSALQNATPDNLQLLGTIPGDFGVERELHRRFSDLRIRGEWYKPEKPLLAYIQSLPKCNGKTIGGGDEGRHWVAADRQRTTWQVHSDVVEASR